MRSSGRAESALLATSLFGSTVAAMPFADEIRPVTVIPYQDRWRVEFLALANTLWRLELAEAGAIDHIGSTSVPGLAAKAVIDIQVRVPAIEDGAMTNAFADLGYRRRPEAWNNVEATRGGSIPKLMFAPPVGGRPCNVHVRTDGSTGARDALLFRDFLQQDAAMREAWSTFKQRLAAAAPTDLLAYGQIKQPAWSVLMRGADAWARDVSWEPEPLIAWRRP